MYGGLDLISRARPKSAIFVLSFVASRFSERQNAQDIKAQEMVVDHFGTRFLRRMNSQVPAQWVSVSSISQPDAFLQRLLVLSV